jgi:hypothetical protein
MRGIPIMKNLYPFDDKKGRYIYLANDRYVAQRKKDGYSAQYTFYTLAEAVEWVANKWP